MVERQRHCEVVDGEPTGARVIGFIDDASGNGQELHTNSAR